MNRTRRNFLRNAAAVGAGVLATSSALATQNSSQGEKLPVSRDSETNRSQMGMKGGHHQPSAQDARLLSVITPDVPDLPFEMDNGVKVFHLIAEPVKQEILPGKTVNLWGYNGSAPGPTIQAKQGERVRLMVHNHLPEPTSMHWHGFDIPFDMDGGPGLSQDPIPPGGKFAYEFTLKQEGTFFYHSHMAMQEMMGMIGAFIMHPQEPYDPPADKDFVIILQEYALLPSNPTPNSMSMEFNWLTLNGKSGPACTPLIVRVGDRVRLRLINLGMDHHPVHLHGHQFSITGTEGGRQPKSTWGPNNTVLVGVSQARVVEFVAKNPGNWMIHCHLPHHMMNQMSSMVGPMTLRRGMTAGADMERGMGILREGSAGAQENGPSLGRGMGMGSTLEQATSNGPMSRSAAPAETGDSQMMPMMEMQTDMADISKDANSIPGFPQDAFMEGPVMSMDGMFDRPETRGLRPGWSGYMQGMMTLVRVLPPDQYERIVELRRRQPTKTPHDMHGMHHMDK